MARNEIVVFYDEDCGFCRWTLGLLLSWDRARRLRPATIQSAEGSRVLAAIDPVTRLESAHVALPDGRVFSGGAAFEHVAPLLPAGAPLAALARMFPGAADRGYRMVAGHRTDIGPRLPRSWVAWGNRVVARRAG
jgi:predicted DCC family thiol-disulfide oxidoreductase YuxK